MATGEAAGKPGEAEEMTGVAEKKPGVAAVTIRKCETLAEMHACFALQKEVWKFADAELVPVRIFVVAEKIGGQVIGAFIPGNRADGNDELIGFALAIPGVRNGHSYLHSQMLAIRQQYRNAGLGRRIKLHQREDALARGFDLMEWTFDPLEITPLQGGLPTDRLVAEWWMKSKRVEAVLADAPPATFECRARIEVPAEIYEWKADPAKSAQALAIQKRNRAQFAQAFTEGLSVLGYERNESNERGDGRFLLGKWDEHLGY
jgi:predicted GNAT superfamily acetyltransferase